MDYKFNRAWAEVNLDNIAHNVKEIRRIVDKKVEIMGVLRLTHTTWSNGDCQNTFGKRCYPSGGVHAG